MARKRDIIKEIAEIRQRRRFGPSMIELQTRLFEIGMAFRKDALTTKEAMRYLPVGLVACIEGYLRMAITEIIDEGDPYLTNAENLDLTSKLDFTILRAVHGKKITVGELIAHVVPLNGLAHIQSVISTLLGLDFLKALPNTINRWEHKVEGKPADPMLKDPDKVYRDVTRTFELRHIVCHEIASTYELQHKEAKSCLESCVAFLRTTEELISQTLRPNAPLTQADMNREAGKELVVSKRQLEQALKHIRARLNDNELALFQTAQEKWNAYCEAWAEFVAGEQTHTGTIWPGIYARTIKDVVDRRTDEIRAWGRLSDSVRGD